MDLYLSGLTNNYEEDDSAVSHFDNKLSTHESRTLFIAKSPQKTADTSPEEYFKNFLDSLNVNWAELSVTGVKRNLGDRISNDNIIEALEGVFTVRCPEVLLPKTFLRRFLSNYTHSQFRYQKYSFGANNRRTTPEPDPTPYVRDNLFEFVESEAIFGPTQDVEEAENQKDHSDQCPSLEIIFKKQEESHDLLQDILAQLKRNKETGDVLAKELRLNSRAVSRLKAMVALQGGTDSTQPQSLSQEPVRLAELEANLQNNLSEKIGFYGERRWLKAKRKWKDLC